MRSGGTSSSSPTIWRIAMRPPVPMSTLPTKIVTEPSAWTARYESTTSGASGLPRNRSALGTLWAIARRPSRKATTSSPPVARKARRESISAPSLGGGAQHRANDARVAPAAAEVASQRLPHLLLARARGVREQRARGHHHAGRAVAALRGLLGDERRLDGIGPIVRAEPLDGHDVLADDRARGRVARAHRPPIDEDRAGAALREAAPEFRAAQPEVVTQQVEEGHVGIVGLDLPDRAVDPQRELRHAPPPGTATTSSPGIPGERTTSARRRPPSTAAGVRAHAAAIRRASPVSVHWMCRYALLAEAAAPQAVPGDRLAPDEARPVRSRAGLGSGRGAGRESGRSGDGGRGEEPGRRPRKPRPDVRQARPAPVDPAGPLAARLPARAGAAAGQGGAVPVRGRRADRRQRARRASVEGLCGVR